LEKGNDGWVYKKGKCLDWDWDRLGLGIIKQKRCEESRILEGVNKTWEMRGRGKKYHKLCVGSTKVKIKSIGKFSEA